MAPGARRPLVGGIAALLAALGWLVLRPGSRSLPNRIPAAEAAQPRSGPRQGASGEPRPAAGPPQAERVAKGPALDRAEIRLSSVAAHEPAAGTVDVACVFVLPDGEGARLPRARVVLESASGTRREVVVEDATEFVVPGLEPAPHDVTVEADGFLHRPQRLDIGPEFAYLDPRRLYLWPAAFVAVVVRSPEGRPIAEIARELELEPKRLLVGAFGAHARRAEPGASSDEGEHGLVRFHLPPLYQSWELPGSGVGSLELLADPPMWIRLDLFGRPLAWRPLAPGDTEIVFTLDSAQIAARLATLSLRVVDPAGAPVAGARVTLKADTSAHRREDQQGVPPGTDGRIAFDRVVPGRYALEIESGAALREQRLDLAPGERRELGDVVLAAGPALDLRIVDAGGNPVQAWIELAEYRRGESIKRLYPPNLHRHTRTAGEYRMPLPSVASVVRATPSHPGTVLPADSERRSRSVLVDPASPPFGPIVLLVGDPAELELDVRVSGMLTVRDELDLVLFEQRVEAPRKLVVRIPPGPCVVRRDAAGRDPAFEDRIVLAAGRTTLEVR